MKYNFFEISKSDPDRVDPPCPYFGECGGCQLQHMTEARQLLEKQRWVEHLFKKLVPQEKILKIIPSPKNNHYRRRIQLHVGPGGKVGFYKTGSQQVIPIDQCLIARKELNQKILAVREMALQELQISKKSLSSLSYELTLEKDGLVSIQKSGEERQFVQVNPEANELLQQFLQSLFQQFSPKTVLELFAGNGNLTFALAEKSDSWIAVESNPKAVEEGKTVAQKSLPSIQWVCADTAKFLKKTRQDFSSVDLVLLDPPREGAKECVPFLLKEKFSRIIYVSCNPLTLRRDLSSLVAGGYELEQLQPIDFFPQTTQLEIIANFRFRIAN